MALARCRLVITDEDGTIVDGASVEVRREAGLTLEPLFSDRAGTVGIANPFTAADGRDAGFYCAGGAFKITATKDALTVIHRYVASGTAQEQDFGGATDAAAGIVELATNAEAIAKSSTGLALTPANLAALGASATFAGLVELATDAEAQTGTDTARALTAANLTAAAVKQGKHTIWIPASAMISRATNGAALGSVEMATNKNMFKTLDFDTTTQEFAQFAIHFPKSWNLGTVTFQPVWSHPSTTTNFGVVFGLAGVARSDDDVGDVAFGTAATSTDTGGTTNDIYIGPESAAITIAGSPTLGDTVQFQINRTVADGSDTMAVDARLHGIRLFYTTNAATDA